MISNKHPKIYWLPGLGWRGSVCQAWHKHGEVKVELQGASGQLPFAAERLGGDLLCGRQIAGL